VVADGPSYAIVYAMRSPWSATNFVTFSSVFSSYGRSQMFVPITVTLSL
jgi:hypothetical protein